MENEQIGVLGATSLVGEHLLPNLLHAGFDVVAFSRQAHGPEPEVERGRLVWTKLPLRNSDNFFHATHSSTIRYWICLIPIWVLPDYFGMFLSLGADRIVVLSSTSRFTKTDSSVESEQALARRLAAAETRLIAWAQDHNIKWTILYPTLIYGDGRDKNISDIARFIQRFHCFPLLGPAKGLRQPVFAGDVAEACRLSLRSSAAINNSYNISGGETLTYREMINRIFLAQRKRTRFLHLPLSVFQFVLRLLRILPRFRHWNPAMAERMNQSLVFDHTAATHDFGFSPRSFALEETDLPESCRPKKKDLRH